MRDEATSKNALPFELLTLPVGDRIFMALDRGGPNDFSSLALKELFQSSRSRGIELDVRGDVLERWLNGPNRWPRSRIVLAQVWQEALQSSPSRIGLSLSHTCEVAVAAARVSSTGSAVGIDIEMADRKVPDRVVHRIVHPDDNVPHSLIALWTLKEAVFKAELNADVPFRDISIDLSVGVAATPKNRFHVALGEVQGSVMAIAIAMQPAQNGG